MTKIDSLDKPFLLLFYKSVTSCHFYMFFSQVYLIVNLARDMNLHKVTQFSSLKRVLIDNLEGDTYLISKSSFMNALS